MVCENCGAELPEGARFCPRCGVATGEPARTEERRLVTVLFADVADSTVLASRLDPERTRQIIGAFFDMAAGELGALRGQVEKFIGDAVMAVFGLSQSHEDDALRAIRAGLAIRGGAERLFGALLPDAPPAVRVGIESGDVAVGPGPSRQQLVTGSAVNAAARLQMAATPGEVLVGATTYQLTRGSVHFGPLREVAAKGFDRPLPAYPVQGLTTRSGRRTIPLVARQAELTVLRAGMQLVRDTGRPQLFTALGEAGIGKTRLVDELLAELPATVPALVGEVPPADLGSSLAPLGTMARQLLETPTDGPARQEAEGLARLLREQPRPDVSATLVQDASAGFLRLVDELGKVGPVVLVFDGVENADQALLDMVERLVARSLRRSRPLLVVAAGRPELMERRPSWGSRAENHALLRLTPLSPPASVELAREAGGEHLGDQLANEVAVRAGGNPFFIIEMTGMLLNSTARPGDETSMPATVQAVVSARLDQLSAAHRELVRRLATFMLPFDRDDVRVVADADEADLQALEEAEVLVREEAARPRWRFRHETLRDVAYTALSKRERQQLHVQVAEAFSAAGRAAALVADHLERAARASLDLDPADRKLADRAVEALAGAAELSRRCMDNRPAGDLAERALGLCGPSASWGRREAGILAGLGEARYWLGEYPAARGALDQAADLARRHGDDEALCAALRFQADILLNVAGDVPAAEEMFAEATSVAERAGGTALVRTLLFAGWAPWTRDDFAAADGIWHRALEGARELGDRWAEVRALTSLAVSASDQGDPGRSAEFAQAAMQLATELGDEFTLAVACVQIGRSLDEGGRGEQALACFDRSLEVFDTLGARWEYADALRTRGITLRELDRLDEAERDLQCALRVSEELGERMLSRWTWLALAKVAEGRGDRRAARERRRQADQLRVPAPAAEPTNV